MAADRRLFDTRSLDDAASVLERIERDIVFGGLPPETKLKMRLLKARYGLSGSPMREALAQLAARGLVAQEHQRGFRVPALSAARLSEITRARQLVEAEALRLAMVHGGAAWEDEIVASFGLLEAELKRRGRADRSPEDFEARHHRFHRALIAACPLPDLRAFCDGLYIQATRYRNLLREIDFGTAPVREEHEILMRAALGRSPAKAVAALKAHIGLTADILLGRLETAKTTDAKPASQRAQAVRSLTKQPARNPLYKKKTGRKQS